MPSELINVRVPKELLASVRAHTKRKGYKNVQEYIREAMRKQNLLDVVEASAGSMPNARPLTREDRIAATREFYEKKGWDVDELARASRLLDRYSGSAKNMKPMTGESRDAATKEFMAGKAREWRKTTRR